MKNRKHIIYISRRTDRYITIALTAIVTGLVLFVIDKMVDDLGKPSYERIEAVNASYDGIYCPCDGNCECDGLNPDCEGITEQSKAALRGEGDEG